MQRRFVSQLGHTTARRVAAMALADSSENKLVGHMIGVEDALAFQI